jgi:hypothetical protein
MSIHGGVGESAKGKIGILQLLSGKKKKNKKYRSM